MKVNNKKQLDDLSNQGSVFMKVDEGEYLIRLMSEIHAVKEHGIEIGAKYHAKACPTENARMLIAAGISQATEVPPCPLCELGYPVTTSYLAAVVLRETEEFDKKTGEKVIVGGSAWVLKKGPSLMGELQNLLDDDNWGATGNYDVKITSKGQGFGRKYSVLAISADKCKPINEKENTALNAMYEKVNFEDMTQPRTYAEIKAFIDENLIDVYVPKKK